MLIYKIISPNTDLVYVGMTVRRLVQRLACHRSNYKRYLAGISGYCSSYKVLECGDCTIELIEETDDKSREFYWIRELNTCNDCRYHQSERAQKYVAERDGILEDRKASYVINKDAILEDRKAYYQRNKKTQAEKIACDNCGRVVSRSGMTAHKKRKSCQNTASAE